MKNLLLTFILIASISLQLKAQHAYIQENKAIKTGYNAFVFDLNKAELINRLASAPLQNAQTKSSSTVIELPLASGKLESFEVVESPIMASELAAKFPQIKTYKVKGSGASGRISITEKGFHGIIFTTNGTVYIDPIPGNATAYQAYNRSEYMAFYDFTKGHSCEVDGSQRAPEYINIPSEYHGNAQRSGDQLRTYRLALSCTGEYAQFHGGTVSSVLSAMVVSMNRVNGVYERDFAITMQLIGNNDQLIFFDASSDPFSNNSGNALLGQNQDAVDNIIGTANYDIGHIFSTGGGGVAILGSVCSGNYKAMGVTGGPSPIGDPFDIDYVAHEMGHQFGGNHTQNNQCNRESSAAFEPGSASTIMGYAGICAPDLQNHSDDYFHSGNFDEVVAFSQNGFGNTCAVITNTGNTKPSVSIGSGGFTIPKETPFVLRGSATDIDGDNLTYCWEEMDLGPSTHPNNPSGNAPAFRSWNPVDNGERTCPRLIDIVQNTTVMGETYIDYGRNMKFRLTVRDNNLAGGGVDYKQFQFAVDGNKGPFEVTTPVTGAQVEAGTYFLVEWDVASTNLNPINCQVVNIILCSNNGLVIEDTLALGVPNSGSYLTMVPNNVGANYRIRVEAADNIFFNLNPGGFQIVPAVIPANYEITLTLNPDFINDKIELNWTDSFNNEIGWVIQRAETSTGNFITIDSVGVNDTTYTDSTLTMYGIPYVYRVYAYNTAGNSNFSNEASYNGVGINELATKQFRVFPNPAKDKLTIQSNNASHIVEVELRDIKGSIILKTEPINNSIDVSSMTAGSYFILIKTASEQEIQPITIIDKH